MPRLRHPISLPTRIAPGTVSDVRICDNYEAPYVTLEAVGSIHNDTHAAMARTLLEDPESAIDDYLVNMVTRSGLSRAGVHAEIDDVTLTDQEEVWAWLRVYDLRRGGRISMVNTLKKLAQERRGDVNTGDMYLVPSGAVYGKESVERICNVERGRVLLPEGAEIMADGLIKVPVLPNIRYFLDEDNFSERRMREVYLRGKHSLDGIHEPRPGLPEEIGAKELLVGAMQLSLGPYHARIVNTNHPDVFHLSADTLHGIRTTGIEDDTETLLLDDSTCRQLELYNNSSRPVKTEGLCAFIELLRADPKTVELGEDTRVINRSTLRHGVQLRNLYPFEEHVETVERIMDRMSSSCRSDAAYGYVVGKGRVLSLDWRDSEARLHRHTGELVETEFLAPETSDMVLRGHQIPPEFRELSDVVGYVGRRQNSNVFFSHALPDQSAMQQMRRNGIDTFLMRHVAEPVDMFENGNGHPPNMQTFTSRRYQMFCDLERSGSDLYMACAEAHDPFRDETVPAHVRKFTRGLWVRESDIPRLSEVEYPVAFYGSNLDGMADFIRPYLRWFVKELAEEYGEKLAVMQGNGPGMMLEADEAARLAEVFRIGVGIAVERKNQSANPGPHARVEFRDHERLARQQVMDCIQSTPLFFVGGGGTLEEAAISQCSQKLGNNIPAPMIFIDPMHWYQESQEHLWQNLRKQIGVLSDREGQAFVDAESNVITPEKPLLPDWLPNTVHLVTSFEEALKIMIDYTRNPIDYIRHARIDACQYDLAYETELATLKQTGFPMPWYVPTPEEYRQKV